MIFLRFMIFLSFLSRFVVLWWFWFFFLLWFHFLVFFLSRFLIIMFMIFVFMVMIIFLNWVYLSFWFFWCNRFWLWLWFTLLETTSTNLGIMFVETSIFSSIFNILFACIKITWFLLVILSLITFEILFTTPVSTISTLSFDKNRTDIIFSIRGHVNRTIPLGYWYIT